MYADVDYFFNFIFALLASCTRLIALMIYEAQPRPYMDEIFHIPQVQAYCNNSFYTWDPKITTLPGLYLFSLGILKPLGHVLKSDLCHTYYLRIINVGFCAGTFYILSLILAKKQDIKKARLATLSGLSITLFPVLYFFNFLYYTEFGSTFFVLFAYLLHIHSCHKSSAVIGAMSVLFRQTNIVWVVFMGWLAGSPFLFNEKKSVHTGRNDLEHLTDLKNNLMSIFKSSSKFNIKSLFDLIRVVLAIVWPYIIVVAVFIIFLVFNGGIVLGAKDDHEAGLHICQILYFSLFSVAFLIPIIPIFKILSEFRTFCQRQLKFVLVLIFLIILIIHYTTVAHRYLLSDNRHYTFYVWKNVFQRHWSIRYLLTPFYLLSIFTLWCSLKPMGFMWRLGFSLCLFAALIPSPLLEFRYFIIPFLLLRLNFEPRPGFVRVACEMVLYCIINAFTIYMFLYKPFTWPDSDELQRFMF